MKIQPGANRRKNRLRKAESKLPTKLENTTQPTESADLSKSAQEEPQVNQEAESKPSSGRGRRLLKTGLAMAGVGAVATLAMPGAAYAQSAGTEVAAAAATETAEAVSSTSSGFSLPSWAPVAIAGVVGAAVIYAMLRNKGGAEGPAPTRRRRGSFSKGNHTFDWVDKVDKGFKDVAGIKEAKAELMEMVDFLKSPERFTKLGAKMPRGALLEGPPGTGKTLLAEAVAGESGLPFVKVSGSEFVEKYVGVGASRVRELFAQARDRAAGTSENGENKGAIIFIDEIDAIGQQRTGESNSAERERTLNQILVEMSGFKNDENILVIAATNRAELLDSALTRSGRFDRKITVDSPSRAGREAILKIHGKNKPLAEGVNLADVAARTPGLVGADMAAIMNEASIYAARDGADAITDKHLSLAIDKVIMGEQRSGTLLTQKERISTAYHEGGHAIVASALPSNGEVHKVSILPRGKALGVCWTAPEEDKHGYAKEELEDKIAMLMGGRAAEELVFGEITTGASNDIERATRLANSMVTTYAMDDEVGTINLSAQRQTGYRPSGALAEEASTSVKEILDEQYNRALKILETNRDALNDISEGMLDHEELGKKQIDAILGDRVKVERETLDLEQFRPKDKQGKGPVVTPSDPPEPPAPPAPKAEKVPAGKA